MKCRTGSGIFDIIISVQFFPIGYRVLGLDLRSSTTFGFATRHGAFRSEDGLELSDRYFHRLAPEHVSKVLEPFGQVDSSLARKYEGTGLGLPLTRQMVELHGGHLELDSVLGQGTSVTVTLPGWRLIAAENSAAECAA